MKIRGSVVSLTKPVLFPIRRRIKKNKKMDGATFALPPARWSCMPHAPCARCLGRGHTGNQIRSHSTLSSNQSLCTKKIHTMVPTSASRAVLLSVRCCRSLFVPLAEHITALRAWWKVSFSLDAASSTYVQEERMHKINVVPKSASQATLITKISDAALTPSVRLAGYVITGHLRA